MAQRHTLAEIRERTYKSRDAWWTVWLVDPLASRLVWLVSPWRWVTPNRLTVSAFVLGLGSAAAFWHQGYAWLLLGAALFHLSFVLDCMDGKIARLNGTGSAFGAWLDYVFDRLRVLACAIGLFGGEYHRTHDFGYLWLGLLVIFLDMFRYLNALEMGKVRGDMRRRLTEAGVVPTTPEASLNDELQEDFRAQFGRFAAVRQFLVNNRIRVHLISGIEFMMFVFIVGPVIGQIKITTIAISVGMIAFELLLIYKLWTNTKSFARRMAKVQAAHDAEATGADLAGAPGSEPATGGAAAATTGSLETTSA
ncbi:CDP-alcohol phosphatidyltransferase family protein [Actinoplanes teichomyceticus]|uniref:CDP-alcohol phosphatidyltransferase-like enzyme n=1 Tax=Actinoplanes teichomyceticus TaxID=1867 RepID=A0A561WAL3_ACTTI|nr:CDP-alcohol phosphatidyltransferase family protein [Actinoplanes teichomyceticus]TWG20895.1 CDP-alcohol phosphatidyltransferase-like enzyme [Actinoplanes teichomyceticus]